MKMKTKMKNEIEYAIKKTTKYKNRSPPPAPLTSAVTSRLLIFRHANGQAPSAGPFVPIESKLKAHSDKTCELSSW